MKTLIKLLLLIAAALLFISCGVVNRLEASHYHFYYNTKALIVIDKKGKKLLCSSPAGIRYYKVRDTNNRFQPGDTIDLRFGRNDWVYANTRFLQG